MNQQASYKALKIVYNLVTSTNIESSAAVIQGTELYKLVEQTTVDGTLSYQMSECRSQGWGIVKTLQYLNHRLNIGFF